MYRDLSLPKTLPVKPTNLYMRVDDRWGTNDDFNTTRPRTLRHSWYKAAGHHFEDQSAVHLKLHELRINELKLLLEQKLDHALMLNKYLVPLQALLDTVLDNESNYEYNLTNARQHRCEGAIKAPTR